MQGEDLRKHFMRTRGLKPIGCESPRPFGVVTNNEKRGSSLGAAYWHVSLRTAGAQCVCAIEIAEGVKARSRTKEKFIKEKPKTCPHLLPMRPIDVNN